MPVEPAGDADLDGIRAGDADRERLAGTLGRHYAEGRLDTDELSRRLEVVYGAVSIEQAAATLADLPPLEERPAKRAGGRRRGESGIPGAGWISTTERFRDPSTRRVMRVWIDPSDGSRHYIAETAGGAP